MDFDKSVGCVHNIPDFGINWDGHQIIQAFDIGASGASIFFLASILLDQRSIDESFFGGVIGADMVYIKLMLIGCLMLFSLKFNSKGLLPEVPSRPTRPLGGAPMSKPVLKVNSLRKEFGGLVAVKDVSFEVGKGEFVGLIGPNGCGKSTTFNCISGLLQQTSGEIEMFRRTSQTSGRSNTE